MIIQPAKKNGLDGFCAFCSLCQRSLPDSFSVWADIAEGRGKQHMREQHAETVNGIPRLLCPDCNEVTESFMVRDSVWDAAVGPKGSDRVHTLCLDCLETRLGRPLVADDFGEPGEERFIEYPDGEMVDVEADWRNERT